MSISSLFSANQYDLYCDQLNVRELTAGDIINPSAIIDDIYTDRIHSGQTDDIVFNLSSGNAVLSRRLEPDANNTIDIGTSSDRFANVYAVNSNATNVVATNVTSNNVTVNTSLIGPVGGVSVNPGVVFSGSNQTLLNKYYQISGSMPISGAIIASASYVATLIGDFVSLSFTFPNTNCTANTSIDIEFLPVPLRPIKTFSGSIRVQLAAGNLTSDGLIQIFPSGEIVIFAGETDTSHFTISNSVGLGYSGTTYFNIGYHIN